MYPPCRVVRAFRHPRLCVYPPNGLKKNSSSEMSST